jgi:hypothetical protein
MRGLRYFLASALCLMAFFGSALAQSVVIYGGLLENSWQDWSWCADDLANTEQRFESGPSIKVTYKAAWQGFYLHSATGTPLRAINTLTFKINGGQNAGRAISLAVTVNQTPVASVDLNNYLPEGVPEGSWAQVTVPLSDFGLTPNQIIDGFWLQDSSGGPQPAFYLADINLPIMPPASPTIVRVYAGNELHAIDPKMFGVNVAVWDQGLTSTMLGNLINGAGYRSFRFPGGSLSDGYHWGTNTTDQNTWTWTNSFDDFVQMSHANAQNSFITVNYGTGTPLEAAAWVQYSNQIKHYGYRYWEVGNECFGSWEEDSQNRPHDPITYATRFAQYYQAMKSADPSALVGAVIVANEDDYANYSDESATNPRTGQVHHGWSAVMLATMARLGVHPDFVAYHRYPEDYFDCDYSLLLDNVNWAKDMAAIRQMLADYLGPASNSTALMCTENNSDSGPNGRQSTSLVNALYLADSVGSIMQTEAQSYLWWDLVNGSDMLGDFNQGLYGWRQNGDLGVLSTDFSSLYPTYYAQQLLSIFAAPGDFVLQATNSYPLLSAYATRRGDGKVRVLLINKNPGETIHTTLAIFGYIPQPGGTIYQYGMDQDSAAEYGLELGYSVTSTTHLGPASKLDLPPYSITVVEFSPLKFSVNPTGGK